METAHYLKGELLTGHFVYVRNDAEPELRIIADAVAEAEQLLVVTGAGISTAASIPISPGLPLQECSKPIETHKDEGKLIQWYAGNVDELERTISLLLGEDATANCIPLHGSAESLRFLVCCETYLCDEELEGDLADEREPLVVDFWHPQPKLD
ncbi:hypothetical protein V8F06_011650 [Rhypophila decipiens]